MGWRREDGRQRQRGIALPLYASGALAVVGAAGLALDLGLAYITKSQLQNALDAAAIAGAYTLNTTGSSAGAVDDAEAAFALNDDALPAGTVPTVEMSPTLDPWDPAGLSPKYVRVEVDDLDSPVFFASVLGLAELTMNGSAVAGFIPQSSFESSLPIALCGNASDTNCADGACYGLGPGEMEIKGDNTSLGPGNYGLLELGCSGSACVRENFAGGTDEQFSNGDTVETKPGVSAGPTRQGINTRFNQYSGPVSAAEYHGDVVTLGPLTYSAYKILLANEATWDNPDGTPQRRIAVAPVVSCNPPINGSSTATVIGTVCLFLTRPMTGGSGSLYGEIAPSCLVEGGGAPPGGGGGGGPGGIVLYQDI